ncbi:hypothetical protein RIF29_25413 [Crotalaria pallida]|uniref:Uncharacterized protein n=1 Tax=Crotalaria pallida TaxID=3830 RepID=A0AAN9EMC8_CROPI
MPTKQQDEDGDQGKLDLTQLDEEDLEDIENLTPKKATELLRNLDVLREKIKGKAEMKDVNHEEKSATKDKEEQQPTKQWVEKKKPSREEIEKMDDALRADDVATVESATQKANSSDVAKSDTIVAETVPDSSDDASTEVVVSKTPPKEQGSKPGKDDDTGKENTENAQEQPWITVRTRSKQNKIDNNKGQSSVQNYQASKANG